MLDNAKRLLGCWVVAASVVACGSPDAAVAPPPSTGLGQYWALSLDHRAVTMSTVAPYDTIRLSATPRDAAGNVITGFPMPTFTTSDVKSLQVDSNGVVHALATGNGILVIASLSRGSLTLADTANVNVTDVASPPTLAVFSIHPDSGDSAETSVNQGRSLPMRALDASGAPIAGLSVYYASSDPGTATIDRSTGFVQGSYPGRVTFIATATAYGITRADTLPFVIGWPIFAEVLVSVTDSSSAHVTLGTGANVIFANPSTTPVAVTFDDSTQVDSSPLFCALFGSVYPWVCGSGNITPFARDSTVTFSNLRPRWFPVPGTYRFHSRPSGTTGALVVVDWRTL